MSRFLVILFVLFTSSHIIDGYRPSHRIIVNNHLPAYKIWISGSMAVFRWRGCARDANLFASIEDITSESDAQISIASRDTIIKEMQFILENRLYENVTVKASGKLSIACYAKT